MPVPESALTEKLVNIAVYLVRLLMNHPMRPIGNPLDGKLRHELVHSFVAKLAGCRCPSWLNEGIAQFLEPKGLGGDGHQLALLFKAQQEIPLNTLEGSFNSFSGPKAYLAYAESLAAVSYIADSYGLSDLERILDRISQGSSTEAALRETIHADYGQLESDLGRYLADRYGD